MTNKQFNVRAYDEHGVEQRTKVTEDENGSGVAAELYLREDQIVKVEIHKVVFKPKPKNKPRKCDHQFRDKDSRMRTGERCGKPANWEVEAWAVTYGVPQSGYFCDEHVEANGPGTFPKIGSNFEMKIKPYKVDDE